MGASTEGTVPVATEAAKEVLQGARFWPAYGPERVWQCVGVQSRLETQSA